LQQAENNPLQTWIFDVVSLYLGLNLSTVVNKDVTKKFPELSITSQVSQGQQKRI